MPESTLVIASMMTSSNGNIFRVTVPLCGEFTGQRWIPLTKASDAELWCCCFFICAWINSWVNNREAGDLRRHRVHYDVDVMSTIRIFVLPYIMWSYLCLSGCFTALRQSHGCEYPSANKVDGLGQECSISNALAIDILRSWMHPMICSCWCPDVKHQDTISSNPDSVVTVLYECFKKQ